MPDHGITRNDRRLRSAKASVAVGAEPELMHEAFQEDKLFLARQMNELLFDLTECWCCHNSKPTSRRFTTLTTTTRPTDQKHFEPTSPSRFPTSLRACAARLLLCPRDSASAFRARPSPFASP